LIVMVAFDNLY